MLIEVLVALLVVAVSLAAIGSVIATNVRNTRSLAPRLALAETARAIATGLPDRKDLALGSITGEMSNHRWRVDVAPFGRVVDPRVPWVPHSVVVTVRAPTGQTVQLTTLRLLRQGQVQQ